MLTGEIRFQLFLEDRNGFSCLGGFWWATPQCANLHDRAVFAI